MLCLKLMITLEVSTTIRSKYDDIINTLPFMPRPNYTALRRQTLSDKVHILGFLKGGDTPKISNNIWISNLDF